MLCFRPCLEAGTIPLKVVFKGFHTTSFNTLALF